MTSKCPGAAVEVDDLADRQTSIAPAGVDVEVAEEKRLVSRHADTLTSRVVAVRGPMPQDLGPEVAHVQAEHLPLPHRHVAPRRRPHPAVAAHDDGPDRGQPAAEVCVLAVELDAAVEAANLRQRRGPYREVAAVENGAHMQHLVQQHMGWRRHEPVVGPNQRAPRPVPVVEPVRSGHRDGVRQARHPAFDAGQPVDGRTAVGVHVREHIAARGAPRRLTRDDQPLGRLVQDADAGNRARYRPGRVGARVVDDQDFVGRARLRQQGMETGRKVPRFVVSHTRSR